MPDQTCLRTTCLCNSCRHRVWSALGCECATDEGAVEPTIPGKPPCDEPYIGDDNNCYYRPIGAHGNPLTLDAEAYAVLDASGERVGRIVENGELSGGIQQVTIWFEPGVWQRWLMGGDDDRL